MAEGLPLDFRVFSRGSLLSSWDAFSFRSKVSKQVLHAGARHRRVIFLDLFKGSGCMASAVQVQYYSAVSLDLAMGDWADRLRSLFRDVVRGWPSSGSGWVPRIRRSPAFGADLRDPHHAVKAGHVTPRDTTSSAPTRDSDSDGTLEKQTEEADQKMT